MHTPKTHAVRFILLGTVLASAGVYDASAEDLFQQAHYDTLAAKSGERCAVCGARLTDNDVALIVKGRRVPLDRMDISEFMQHQDKYFASLQPKGALFQEEMGPESGGRGSVGMGWFLFGLYVLIALLSGGLSGYAAIGKGLKPLPNFFVGFAFSIFGYIYVLTRPRQGGEIPTGLVKVPDTAAPIACPKCGNTNHPTARRCSACQAELQPATDSEASRASRS